MFLNDFELIYRQYYQQVYLFLYRLCSSSDDAEELTSRTFYRLYKTMYRYDGSCDIYTWICAIAKKEFFKFLAKTDKKTIKINLYVMNLAADINDEPGRHVSEEVDVEKLRATLADIPEKYTDVFVLKLFAEIPFDEISKRLRISENTAKVLFFRTKKQIKEKLFDEKV